MGEGPDATPHLRKLDVGYTEWTYPGWEKDWQEGDWKPYETKPFWIVTIQKHPLLVVASQVPDKAMMRESHMEYAILFDPDGGRILDSIFTVGGEFTAESGYLMWGDGYSGQKGVSDSTYFSRIQNNKITAMKEWHYVLPGDQSSVEGDNVVIVKSDGKTYTLKPDFNDSPQPDVWMIFAGQPSQESVDGMDGSAIRAWEKRKPIAKVEFTLKASGEPVNQAGDANHDSNEDEYAWLFSKLTGLPRGLYPLQNPDTKIRKIESIAKIKVTGDAQMGEASFAGFLSLDRRFKRNRAGACSVCSILPAHESVRAAAG